MALNFEILVEDTNTSITIRMEYYILFNSDIMNLVWKADEGEAESICLLIFTLCWCFNCCWMRVCGWGRKSYLGPAEIPFISSQDLSWSNKHITFWHVLLTRYFYILFLWSIAASDFLPLEIYKNLGLPLSSITLKVNNHTDNHFCKYICFKYYTIWNHFQRFFT